MAKSKKPAPKEEDPEQSRRFLEEARAIEADGGLSGEEAEKAFESVMGKVGRNDPQGKNSASS